MQEVILWVGVAAFVLGALAIAALGRASRVGDQHHTVVSVLVPLIAACAYFSMAIGQGAVQLGDKTIYFARYLDWVFTTPLLLLGILTVGLAPLRAGLDDARQRNGLVGGVIAADVLMIITGLFAALSTDSFNKYVWYTISCVFFLIVLVLLWGPVRQAARTQSSAIEGLYGRLLAILTVLWLIYPVLWLLGTEGLDLISLDAEVLVFVVIDVSAKVGFGLLLVMGAKKIVHRPAAEGAAARG